MWSEGSGLSQPSLWGVPVRKLDSIKPGAFMVGDPHSGEALLYWPCVHPETGEEGMKILDVPKFPDFLGVWDKEKPLLFHP